MSCHLNIKRNHDRFSYRYVWLPFISSFTSLRIYSALWVAELCGSVMKMLFPGYEYAWTHTDCYFSLSTLSLDIFLKEVRPKLWLISTGIKSLSFSNLYKIRPLCFVCKSRMGIFSLSLLVFYISFKNDKMIVFAVEFDFINLRRKATFPFHHT